MFKVYKKADILEKISDKVKTVDDLLHLPRSEWDRELCDFWFNDMINDEYYQTRGYNVFYSLDMNSFFDAFYLMECCDRCKFLVLIEFGERLYFVFDSCGFATLENDIRNEREELLRKVADLTNLLPVLVANNPDYPF